MLRFQSRWALDWQGFRFSRRACIGYRSAKIALECRKRLQHSDLGLRLSISKSQVLPRLLWDKRNRTNFCGTILFYPQQRCWRRNFNPYPSCLTYRNLSGTYILLILPGDISAFYQCSQS